jgi:dTDP-4-dehydrorhamnose reductase
MIIAVTGAAGGVGRAFLSRLPPEHDWHVLTHDLLDIGHHREVMETFRDLKPEAIVNCAAMTKVDECERSPAAAYRTNTTGPHNLALAAKQLGAILLHISTDYVFDGAKPTPYDELDTTNPLSVYGRSKLGGEGAIREVLPEHFIVRTGYLFGSGTDYLTGAVNRLRAGEMAGGLVDRIGTPTYVVHFAERLIQLMATERFGTYHLAGPEPTSWHDVLTRVKGLTGYLGEVTTQRAVDLKLQAPRPSNSALTSLYVHDMGIDPMPPLDAALADAYGGPSSGDGGRP